MEENIQGTKKQAIMRKKSIDVPPGVSHAPSGAQKYTCAPHGAQKSTCLPPRMWSTSPTM